jgi:hypothetical protein
LAAREIHCKNSPLWENYPMTTVKADERRRVTIPCAEPGQEFAWREGEDGAVILTPVERLRPRKLRKVLVRLSPGQVAELPPGVNAKDFEAGISQAIREEREGQPE